MADLNVCTQHAEQLVARARNKKLEISVRVSIEFEFVASERDRPRFSQ
jgi:hypothetical protein